MAEDGNSSARLFRNGAELGSIDALTEPRVVHSIPIYGLGSGSVIAWVDHVTALMTVPFVLPDGGQYEVVRGNDAAPLDALVLAAEDDWHCTYAYWARIPRRAS